MINIKFLFFSLLFVIMLVACSAEGTEVVESSELENEEEQTTQADNEEAEESTTEEAETYITLMDDLGNEVVLEEKPERIVVLSPSHLTLLYDLGGEAIARTTLSPHSIPQGAEEIEDVGHHTNVNVEAIVALAPDLVIGNTVLHEKLIPILADSNISFINLDMKLIDDVKRNARLYGKFLGDSEMVEQHIANLEQEIAAIQGEIPEGEEKKVVIFNITPSSVSVKMENTISGEISNMLGLTNIAEGASPIEGRPTQTPFSLEKIVEEDPDFIFIVHHGERTVAEDRMDQDMKNSPAWSTLKAVQEDNVHFLPGNLFLSNPGIEYHQSIRYLAEIVYPEVFGNVE
ncbi:iron complex transport system substrate-binding protein [Evansella vedderi]|uniref:Iron complex transport system substrate-binding protein n=1 Tax=Evansella vedderi TaxID=38282 RepID=A0ABT9ZNB8_9BACI|nr:ABC transporter substrate-binding protein [Evansella vedderi]MDQ0252734.1 iron complex transport system substrate-binding protein [Evansella vedderi]